MRQSGEGEREKVRIRGAKYIVVVVFIYFTIYLSVLTLRIKCRNLYSVELVSGEGRVRLVKMLEKAGKSADKRSGKKLLLSVNEEEECCCCCCCCFCLCC